MQQASDDEELVDTEEQLPDAGTGDALIPDCGMEDEDVERLAVPYSTRAPGDWVVSGPLANPKDKRGGRYFETWDAAEVWARRKYGRLLKGRISEAASFGGRWAFLVAPIEVN